MKLKIKVKNLIMILVLSLFIIFILGPIANLEIATYLMNKDSLKAQSFFNNYMASPIKLNKKRGLYEYAKSLTGDFEKYQINFNSWGSSSNTSPEDMEKAISLFQEILLNDKESGYKNEYSTKSYLKLLDASIASLDTDSLLYWVDWGQDSVNEEIKLASDLYRAYYHFAQMDYKQSQEILESIEEEKRDEKYYTLLGDVYLHLGEVEKAQKTYESLWKDHPQSINSYKRYFGGSSRYSNGEGIQSYIEKTQGDYKIKGKISSNGEGLAFVEVFIKKDIGTLYMGPKIPDAVTDENGNFETQPLKGGVYEIGIEINPSQLYNKVFLSKDIRFIELDSDLEFNFDFVNPIEIISPKDKASISKGADLHISWDKVEEADYYMLESLVFTNPKEKSGGSYRLPLKDKNGQEKIKDNNMRFNIETSYKETLALVYDGEEERVNPTAIFGSFVPDVDYPIIVNAYDKEDNLIGSSFPLIANYEDITSISLDGDLSKGEKLILDKKYQAAISLYEDFLVENPLDKEALFYLTKMYSIGWKIGEKDIPKALKYAEIYDKNYKDYNLPLEVVEFMEREDMEKNKDLVKAVLENTKEKDRDDNYYYKKARYHIVEGDLVKARKSYDKQEDQKSITMVYIDLFLEDYEKAKTTLKSGDVLLIKMDRRKLIDSLEDIENISPEDKAAFKKLLKAAIENNLNIEERESLYKDTIKRVKNPELKSIIKEIGREEYWDYERLEDH